MQFYSNMTFKDFFNLLNEAGRSRSSGGRSDKPAADVDERPNAGIRSKKKDSGVDKKGRARGEKGGPKTRGQLSATPEVGSVPAVERGAESILDPRRAVSVTGATYSTAKAMNREMDDVVTIPKQLIEDLKQMYPESARFSTEITKTNIGTTLNALFAEHGELSPSQMYKTISGGLISEYVNLLIEGYIKMFPESILETDKGKYITTLANHSEHYKYSAPYEEDPKYKKIYNLTTKRLLRDIVAKKGHAPTVQTIHFPEYSTYKLQDIGRAGSAVQQRSAYFGTASTHSGITPKK
jgi:hypothetical protein